MIDDICGARSPRTWSSCGPAASCRSSCTAAGRRSRSMLTRLGIPSDFRGGLRVTTPRAIDVVRMVLVGPGRPGRGRPDQPARRRARSACPVRTAGCSPPPARTAIVDGDPVDIGLVGDVVTVDPAPVAALLDAGHIPVVSARRARRDGAVHNVNADTAAAALAVALRRGQAGRAHRRRGALRATGPTATRWSNRSTPASWPRSCRARRRDGARRWRRACARSRAACNRAPSSTAGSRTRCCWRCSPPRAPGRWWSRPSQSRRRSQRGDS